MRFRTHVAPDKTGPHDRRAEAILVSVRMPPHSLRILLKITGKDKIKYDSRSFCATAEVQDTARSLVRLANPGYWRKLAGNNPASEHSLSGSIGS